MKKKLLSWILSGALFASTLVALPAANLATANVTNAETTITASAVASNTVKVTSWDQIQKAVDEAAEGSSLTVLIDVDHINANSSLKINKKMTIEMKPERFLSATIFNYSDDPLFYLDAKNINLKFSGFFNLKNSSKERKSCEGAAVYVNQDDCTVEGGIYDSLDTTGDCGAIYVNGKNCKISKCEFTFCSALDNGGAVYVNKENCTISNCEFSYCDSLDDGGAIYVNKDNCTIDNCTFESNQAYYKGGAIYVCGENCKIQNSKFNDCYAENSGKTDGNGGSIYVSSVKCKIEKCDFWNSYAYYAGGAIYMDEEGEINECNFSNCTANRGGAIYDSNFYGGDLIVYKCNFSGCTAKVKADWVYGNDDAKIKECTVGSEKAYYQVQSIENNEYTEKNHVKYTKDIKAIINGLKVGDRVDIYFDNDITIDSTIEINKSCDIYFHAPEMGCTIYLSTRGFYLDEEEIKLHFIGNIKIEGTLKYNSKGEAIYVNDDECLIEGAYFKNCGAYNNSTKTWFITPVMDGGAIYVDGEDCTIRYCTFEGCKAGSDGGAIGVNKDDCSITYCEFKNNVANRGGAIFVTAGTDDCIISQCSFTDNKSEADGGASNEISGRSDTYIINCEGVKKYVGCAIMQENGFIGKGEIGAGAYLGSIFSNGGSWIVVGVGVTAVAAIVVLVVVKKKKNK